MKTTPGSKRGRKKLSDIKKANTSDIQQIDKDTVFINGIEIDIEKISDD
jgi:hypothetical protein